VKIILAHLGGSTPFLAARVAVLAKHMGCSLSHDDILQDFKSFYYETALSAYEPTLTAMKQFVPPDHILFGTDFPGQLQSYLPSLSLTLHSIAVSSKMAEWYTSNLEDFYTGDTGALSEVMNGNALKLFPRLRGPKAITFDPMPNPLHPMTNARL